MNIKIHFRLLTCLFFLAICGQQLAHAQTNNIFDGKSLSGWTVLAGSADFKVENGIIIGTTVLNSGNTFLSTKKEYGDFILELDVKAEDQGINSGIQIRSHFDPLANQGKGKVFGRQCEIDPSARGWSGGIYDEGRREWLYPMDLNSGSKNLFKVGEYNHIRIESIGNETKTWVNGKPAADVVDTIDKRGFIALQVHAVSQASEVGKKVYFKNINLQTTNLKPKSFPAGVYVVNYVSNSLTQYEVENGWRLLFDGKTTKGWRGANINGFPKKGWEISGGSFRVLPADGKESADGGDIITDSLFSAFDLSFEFKLTLGGNSGVKYFVTLSEVTTGSAIGLEYQILDDKNHPDAKLGRDGDRTLSSLYDLITANKPVRFIRPIGAWNTGRIIVYPNNHVEHYLNGVKVLEYERGSKAFKDLVAISKYKIWKDFGEAAKGHILLQDHGNEAFFRSVKIKELK